MVNGQRSTVGQLVSEQFQHNLPFCRVVRLRQDLTVVRKVLLVNVAIHSNLKSLNATELSITEWCHTHGGDVVTMRFVNRTFWSELLMLLEIVTALLSSIGDCQPDPAATHSDFGNIGFVGVRQGRICIARAT